MTKFYKPAIALISLICSLYIFSTSSNEPEISIRELVEWLANSEEIIILDVRKPEELIGIHGQINGVINIPVQELESRIALIDRYREKKIAVICRSGNRSKDGTAILIDNGFNAYNVKGGMKAYNKAIKK
jgi:rhodanese-related sulfurtransferase